MIIQEVAALKTLLNKHTCNTASEGGEGVFMQPYRGKDLWTAFTGDNIDSVALWASRELLRTRVDDLGQWVTRTEPLLIQSAPSLSYAEIFKLSHAEDIHLSDMRSLKTYGSKIAENFQGLRYSMQDAWHGQSPFFSDVSSKVYFQQCLWQNNIQPIMETWQQIQAKDFSTLGSGLARAFGLGYLGFDTLKQTY